LPRHGLLLRTRLVLRLLLTVRLMLLVVLRLMVLLRLVRLRLMVLLSVARIKRRLLRRVGFAAHGWLIVTVIVTVIGNIVVHPAAARLLLVIGLALAELLLRGGDQAKIMFGVLIIILGGDRISGALRVTSELEIFFRDVGRCAPYFYVLPIGLVHSRQRILVMMTAFAIASAHAFVLTVSHGLLFRQPLDARRH